MTRLETHDVKFHPHSFGDPDGRVFLWNDRVYRAIRASSAEFFSSLLASGLADRLTNLRMIVATHVSDVALDGYEMVLAHSRVPFISYPDEWPAPMLHDAARLILNLALELASAGLLLKDSHPWNVLFDSTHPVYVDLTSIAPLGDSKQWIAYQEFCKYCLYPLLLMISGQDRIARLLMPEEEGVRRQDLLPHLGARLRWKTGISRWKRAAATATSLLSHSNHTSTSSGQAPDARRLIAELKQIRSFVDGLPMPAYKDTQPVMSNYETFERLICEKAPSTILDVSGTANYAKVAAKNAGRVVRFDADPKASARLYLDARELSLPILPLVIDFRKPTPARGLADHWAIGAAQRLACEMVVALGVLPSWVFQGRLTFDHVADGLNAFSRRSAVVEFIPRERRDIQSMGESYAWYTIDNLSVALERRFAKVTRVPAENSVYLLCEHPTTSPS
jgi:hypothetical protein